MTDPAGVDTGEPIAELADVAEDPAPGFVNRLWGRIERRRLGGELADLTWQGLVAIVVEYLGVVFDLLRVPESAVEAANDDKEELDE